MSAENPYHNAMVRVYHAVASDGNLEVGASHIFASRELAERDALERNWGGFDLQDFSFEIIQVIATGLDPEKVEALLTTGLEFNEVVVSYEELTRKKEIVLVGT